MVLNDYLRVLRAHWVAILVLTIAGVAVGGGWSLLQPKVYEADATGIVTMNTNGDVGLSALADSLSRSKAKTYVAVAKSRAVADIVIQDLDIDKSAESLVNNISVASSTDTPTITITAKASSPDGARQLADAWVAALAQQVTAIEGTSSAGASAADGVGAISLTAVDSAVLPTSPTSPNWRLALIIGGAIGLLAGIVYAFVRNQLDRKIRDSASIEKQFSVPVLGTIPAESKLGERSQVILSSDARDYGTKDDSYAFAEALREMRTNLQFLDVDNPPRVIVVTSPLPNDGKSTISGNIAVTLAEAGQRVVVVDGDLRKPTVASTFGLVEGAGLTDLLIGKAEMSDVLQPWGKTGNLFVLGAGSVPPNPSELLGSQGMSILLKELSRDAMVIVDAPPLLPVTDAAVLSARTDGALVVVSAGKTHFDELEKAIANITKAKGRTLGVVLNRVPMRGSAARTYGYYGGRYSYGSGHGSHSSPDAAVEPPTEPTNVVPFRTGTGS